MIDITQSARPDWLPADAELRAIFGKTVAYPYYRLRTTEYVARLLPPTGPCRIIDIGAGDGLLARILEQFRPDTWLTAVETHVRPLRSARVQFVKYDGRALPFRDRSFDCALLCNVLHHADDQRMLLSEAMRLARQAVIIKDHVAETRLQYAQLAILDVLGNRRFGASTTGRYLNTDEWNRLFSTLSATGIQRFSDLSFRTFPLRAIFGNRLEIVFRLDTSTVAGAG